MIIENFPQLSEEWFAARTGIPSASKFDKIVTTRGAKSKQSEKYMFQLAGERIIGKKEESYQNSAMARGIELEPQARQYYEMIHDVDVQEVGLVYKDERKLFSCSPDGLMEEGGLEIKCPSLAVHVEYLLNNVLPTAYYQQVQGSLYVTGLKWWDFVSYYPGMKPFTVRVRPDLEFQQKLAIELEVFCAGLGRVMAELQNLDRKSVV